MKGVLQLYKGLNQSNLNAILG